jgi:hypothetical protein
VSAVAGTALPPGRSEGQLAARQWGEAREEVARVGLAVGDVGVGGLDLDHQEGLGRVAGRRTRRPGREVAERCARDPRVVARGEPVGRVGEADVERSGGRAGHGRRGGISIKDKRTWRNTLQRPQVERLAEATFAECEFDVVRPGRHRGHEAVRARRLRRACRPAGDLLVDGGHGHRQRRARDGQLGRDARPGVAHSRVGTGLSDREREGDQSVPGAGDIGGSRGGGHGLGPGDPSHLRGEVGSAKTPVGRCRTRRAGEGGLQDLAGPEHLCRWSGRSRPAEREPGDREAEEERP